MATNQQTGGDRITDVELSLIMNVPSLSRRFDSPQLVAASRRELRKMAVDPRFITNPTKVDDGDSAFVARHVLYLNRHTHINPFHYISNLRTMTRLSR